LLGHGAGGRAHKALVWVVGEGAAEGIRRHHGGAGVEDGAHRALGLAVGEKLVEEFVAVFFDFEGFDGLGHHWD